MMAHLDLRNQPPNPDWFRDYSPGSFKPRDYGGYLVARWDERDLVVALPDEETVVQLPQKAQRYYRRVEEICSAIYRIRKKQLRESEMVPLDAGADSSQMKELGQQLDALSERSLPADRKDWGW